MTEATRKTIKRAISKPGSVISLTLGLIALAALVTTSVMILPRGLTANEPTSNELGVMLYQLGLDPEALTVAGVQAGQVTLLVLEADRVLTEQFDNLTFAERDLADARRLSTRLRRAIRAGVADEGAVAALAASEASAATAESAVTAIRSAVYDAATAHLEPTAVAALRTVAANRHWNLPVQYAVNTRSEADMKRLREALANLRISADYGEDPDSSSSAFVSQENARANTAQAVTYLSTRLTSITTAFETTLTN